MILYLTIAIIAWLALTAVYFINESRKAHEEIDELWHSGLTWQIYAGYLQEQLDKYKRPRDSHGRFTK
jgi:hypothetical protein